MQSKSSSGKRQENVKNSTVNLRSKGSYHEDFNSCNVKSSSRKRQENVKNYIVNPRSGGSFTKPGRKMPISHHELHYTANRAQS